MTPQTIVPLHTLGRNEPSTDVTINLTNERMDEGRWNRLMTLLFTPQQADPSTSE